MCPSARHKQPGLKIQIMKAANKPHTGPLHLKSKRPREIYSYGMASEVHQTIRSLSIQKSRICFYKPASFLSRMKATLSALDM